MGKVPNTKNLRSTILMQVQAQALLRGKMTTPEKCYQIIKDGHFTPGSPIGKALEEAIWHVEATLDLLGVSDDADEGGGA